MSEYSYVEEPILAWLSGGLSRGRRAGGLGWTYRDEAAMAAFERPVEDPLVEKLLIASILQINPEVQTEERAKLAVRHCGRRWRIPIGWPQIGRHSICSGTERE
jgi:type I restriction enzyme R subunit